MQLRRLWFEEKMNIRALACVGLIIIFSMIPESKSVNGSLWFTSRVINSILSLF